MRSWPTFKSSRWRRRRRASRDRRGWTCPGHCCRRPRMRVIQSARARRPGSRVETHFSRKGRPMKKFLVLYKAPISAFEQMKKDTPEQKKAGMDMWMEWGKKAQASIVDMGAPLGKSLRVNKGGGTSP